MDCLIIGGSGQLGTALKAVAPKDFNILSPPSSKLNIISLIDTKRYFNVYKPSVVINCAAYNKVNEAETIEGYEDAIALNTIAVGNITNACREIGATLYHVSTNYVFGDRKIDTKNFRSIAYEEEIPDPKNNYGRTKYAGEILALAYDASIIIRTAGLYGVSESKQKQNFVDKIINKVKNNETVEVINNITSVTYAKNLARKIWLLIYYYNIHKRIKFSKIFHMVDNGITSWDIFAHDIISAINGDTSKIKVIDYNNVKYDKTKFPALLPFYSVIATRYSLCLQEEIEDDERKLYGESDVFAETHLEGMTEYLKEIGEIN